MQGIVKAIQIIKLAWYYPYVGLSVVLVDVSRHLRDPPRSMTE
jgi:hypothetical protein